MIQLRKLNQIGDHVVIIGVFIVLFGVAGTFWLLQDHAATPQQELQSAIKVPGSSLKYCLDDYAGQNTRVDDYQCNGNGTQKYSFSGGAIHLDGGCLGVDGAGTSSWPTKANVFVGSCTPSVPWGGLWTQGPDGSFENNHTDSHYGSTKYCLDITGGSVAEATVEIYKCNYNSNESWTQTAAPGSSGGSTNSGASAYANPFQGCSPTSGRIDQGVDFTGRCTIYPIGSAVIEGSTADAAWPGGTFIRYELTTGLLKGTYVYVAEDCTPTAAALDNGKSVGTDTPLCVMDGDGTGIETGFAQAPADGWIAMAHPVYVGRPDGTATNFGVAYSFVLKYLCGAPSGNIGQSTGGSSSILQAPIPSNYESIISSLEQMSGVSVNKD